MATGVVNVADIVVVDLSATILVKFLVGAFDKSDALGIHGAFHDSQKFVIVDCAIIVLVKSLEKRLNIDVGEVEAGLLAPLSELLKIQRARAIVVHDLEHATDPNDRAGATLQHFGSERLDQFSSTNKAAKKDNQTLSFCLLADALKKSRSGSCGCN